MKRPFPREYQRPDGTWVFDSGMWELTGLKALSKSPRPRVIPLPTGGLPVDELGFWEAHVEKVVAHRHAPHIWRFALHIRHMLKETRRLSQSGDFGAAVACGFNAGVYSGFLMASWKSEALVQRKRHSDEATRSPRGRQPDSIADTILKIGVARAKKRWLEDRVRFVCEIDRHRGDESPRTLSTKIAAIRKTFQRLERKTGH